MPSAVRHLPLRLSLPADRAWRTGRVGRVGGTVGMEELSAPLIGDGTRRSRRRSPVVYQFVVRGTRHRERVPQEPPKGATPETRGAPSQP